MTQVTIAQDEATNGGETPNPSAVPLRVLLIEDDEATRAAISYILKNAGFSVATAADGQQALSVLASGGVDVAVSDIEMPVLDGIRMLALMRRTPSIGRVPVIILTKYASRENVQQCIALGARDMLVKQAMDMQRLVERVQALGAERKQSEATADESDEDAAAHACEVEQDKVIDQQLWKQTMVVIGRITRDQALEAFEDAQVPVLLPQMSQALLDQLEQGAEDPDELVQAIEHEPAMLVSVLREATVSHATGQQHALDVETAVRWIGRAGVEETIRDAVDRAASFEESRRQWMLHWWRHSVNVAQLAEALASGVGISADEARAAGWLHDIGRLLLYGGEIADKALRCYELGRNMAITTAFAEQSLLGLNHKQLGRELCERWSVPRELAGVCETHDLDEAARSRFDPQTVRIGQLIHVADQIAKAAGRGSLPNDELLPLPESMVGVTGDRQSALDAALAEAETLASWRLADVALEPFDPPVNLAGIVIGLVSPRPPAATPSYRLLVQAGARVTAYGDLQPVIEESPLHDILIIDQTCDSLTLMLPKLRRLSKSGSNNAPCLLLARRSDEPEALLSQSGLHTTVYPTPIRTQTLLKLTRKLVGS